MRPMWQDRPHMLYKGWTHSETTALVCIWSPIWDRDTMQQWPFRHLDEVRVQKDDVTKCLCTHQLCVWGMPHWAQTRQCTVKQNTISTAYAYCGVYCMKIHYTSTREETNIDTTDWCVLICSKIILSMFVCISMHINTLIMCQTMHAWFDTISIVYPPDNAHYTMKV